MLLIIENRDDPTDPIAEETEGGSELVYVAAVTAPAKGDAKLLRMECTVARACYELRTTEAEGRPSPQRAGVLMPLFLKALGRLGKRPEYLSGETETAVFGAKPEGGRAAFRARG